MVELRFLRQDLRDAIECCARIAIGIRACILEDTECAQSCVSQRGGVEQILVDDIGFQHVGQPFIQRWTIEDLIKRLWLRQKFLCERPIARKMLFIFNLPARYFRKAAIKSLNAHVLGPRDVQQRIVQSAQRIVCQIEIPIALPVQARDLVGEDLTFLVDLSDRIRKLAGEDVQLVL